MELPTSVPLGTYLDQHMHTTSFLSTYRSHLRDTVMLTGPSTYSIRYVHRAPLRKWSRFTPYLRRTNSTTRRLDGFGLAGLAAAPWLPQADKAPTSKRSVCADLASHASSGKAHGQGNSLGEHWQQAHRLVRQASGPNWLPHLKNLHSASPFPRDRPSPNTNRDLSLHCTHVESRVGPKRRPPFRCASSKTILFFIDFHPPRDSCCMRAASALFFSVPDAFPARHTARFPNAIFA